MGTSWAMRMALWGGLAVLSGLWSCTLPKDKEPQRAEPGPWMLDNPALETDRPGEAPRAQEIRVGILHSLSGPLEQREKPLKDMALMAIAEINARGGVLGRQLRPIVMDPSSKMGAYFEEQAHELLEVQKVAVIFGCWTDRSREQVEQVLRESDGLLFYPAPYGGRESSYHIFYTGSVPNQRALPVVDYLLSPLGGNIRRFALVGTENAYAKSTNEVLRHYLRGKGISDQHVIERYTPHTHTDYEDIVAEIKELGASRSAAVISTLNGESNSAFLLTLAAQGLSASAVPVVSLGVDETLLLGTDIKPFVGHLAATNYAMSIENELNTAFIHNWKEHVSNRNVDEVQKLVTSGPLEATYLGVHLWAQAVEQARTIKVDAVRQALAGQRFTAPSGFEVAIDEKNHHIHRPVFISQIQANGQLRVLWQSPLAVVPEPFSSHVPENIGLVADWTYPWVCGGCTKPQY